MVRRPEFAVLFALCLGCALGEMPGGAPADGGLDEADDEGTPLTTGADDGAEAGGDDAGAGDAGADDAGADDAGDDGADGADADGADGPAGDGSTGSHADDGGTDGGSGGDDTQSDDGATDDGGSTGGEDAQTSGGSDEGGADDGTLPDAIDVSDFQLVQTDAFRMVTLTAGTIVPPGGYLLIGRDATRAEFEAYWGPLPADAVYLDGALLDVDGFPTINGNETYELLDSFGSAVDGPSAPLAVLGNMQRVDPGEPASLEPSWASSIDPDTDATPGAGQVDSALFSGIYISEVSDAVGSGNYVFEFIELYHDP